MRSGVPNRLEKRSVPFFGDGESVRAVVSSGEQPASEALILFAGEKKSRVSSMQTGPRSRWMDVTLAFELL